MASLYSPPSDKISKDDFELLLNNYAHWIYRSSQPGAGSCQDAIHKARLALLNAARVGVSDDGVNLSQTITDRVRVALVSSFCDVFTLQPPDPPKGPAGKAGQVVQLRSTPPSTIRSNSTEDA